MPIGDILAILGHPIGDHLRGTYVPVGTVHNIKSGLAAVLDPGRPSLR
jgi:hypothetical protein